MLDSATLAAPTKREPVATQQKTAAPQKAFVTKRAPRPAPPTPAQPDKKKTVEDKTSNHHWMNNLGYALYAGVGAIKQIGSYQKAVNHNNPTLMVGLTTLLASYPPVFFSHDLYAKMLLLIAFHLSEMAESAGDYNTFVFKEMDAAEKKGISLKQPPLTGLKGMERWLNGDYMRRALGGKLTREDVRHGKQFFGYVLNDQKQAAHQLGESFKAFGQLGLNVGKSVLTLGKTPLKVPQRLQLGATRDPSQYNLDVRRNIYHLENAGAFAGLLGVLGETAGHTLGIHQLTRFLTVPWLMSANLMQTIGFTATTRNIWQLRNKEGKQTVGFKAMAASEGAGTLLEAIGAASWSNDSLLGLYRLGSALKTPFRFYQREVKIVNGQATGMKTLDATTRLARRTDIITLVVDVISAMAILGSPFVQAYEEKHHVDLRNPLNWFNKPEDEQEAPAPVLTPRRSEVAG